MFALELADWPATGTYSKTKNTNRTHFPILIFQMAIFICLSNFFRMPEKCLIIFAFHIERNGGPGGMGSGRSDLRQQSSGEPELLGTTAHIYITDISFKKMCPNGRAATERNNPTSSLPSLKKKKHSAPQFRQTTPTASYIYILGGRTTAIQAIVSGRARYAGLESRYRRRRRKFDVIFKFNETKRSNHICKTLCLRFFPTPISLFLLSLISSLFFSFSRGSNF